MYDFTHSDNVKSVNLVSTSECCLENSDWQQLNEALGALNSVSPISTVVVANNVDVITTKDGRTFTITMTASNPPAFTVDTGGSSFSQGEFNALQVVGKAILALLLTEQMTSLTVTYN